MTAKQDAALKVIAQVSGKDVASIKPTSELTADLGIDSPKSLDLLGRLEETLGFEIDDEEAARMTTVGDVLTFVGSKA